MERLGYSRFVAQGGDWGGLITELMGAQAPPGLIGVHTNFPGTVPPEVEKAIQTGEPPSPAFSPAERPRLPATSGGLEATGLRQ